MFDLSFNELLIIILVTLIVLGPKQMLIVARNLGKFIGKIKYYSNNIINTVTQEIDDNNLNQITNTLKSTAQNITKDVKDSINNLNDSINDNFTATKESEFINNDNLFSSEIDEYGQFSKKKLHISSIKLKKKLSLNNDYKKIKKFNGRK